VDWGAYAGPKDPSTVPLTSIQAVFPLYTKSVQATPVVGTRVAQFVIFLKEQKVFKSYAENVHLIG